MLPSELLSLFRVEMSDLAEPYLWSDAFIIGAIDDAQKQFARKTDGLADASTPAVVDLAVVAGLDTLPLHPSILKIRAAHRTDTGRPVEVVNQEDMDTRGAYFDGRAGRLRALVIGAEPNVVRLWPVPNETITVRLSVFRLPIVTITDDEPLEVAPQHRRHLLLWVKHLAYSVHDAETFDKTKAADFELAFETYCKRAAAEQARARYKPRTVAYGGI